MINHFENIQAKILSHETLQSKLAFWRFKNFKIVFTNGCFDIIHRGHVEYLSKAAALGNILFVGLNTDDSIRKIKGEGRPIQDQQARALVLASMEFVHYIMLFNEETPYELIKTIQPDILVKGSDYKPENIIGADIVQNKGGEIITIELTTGYSTTSIINKSTIK